MDIIAKKEMGYKKMNQEKKKIMTAEEAELKLKIQKDLEAERAGREELEREYG